MAVVHRLTGYDRETEAMAVEFTIPLKLLDKIRAIVQPPDTDPDMIGAYPLTAEQTKEIASLMRSPMLAHKFDFFVECYAC